MDEPRRRQARWSMRRRAVRVGAPYAAGVLFILGVAGLALPLSDAGSNVPPTTKTWTPAPVPVGAATEPRTVVTGSASFAVVRSPAVTPSTQPVVPSVRLGSSGGSTDGPAGAPPSHTRPPVVPRPPLRAGVLAVAPPREAEPADEDERQGAQLPPSAGNRGHDQQSDEADLGDGDGD
jgi:hypothetical protein